MIIVPESIFTELEDETLSTEQLLAAEIQTIYDELNNTAPYNKIPSTYQREMEKKETIGECIKLSACVIFKEYESPKSSKKVDSQNGYELVEGVEGDAPNANSYEDIPDAVQRIMAARVSYQFFMEEH